MTQSIYIPRGVNTDCLSRTLKWDFKPQGFKVSISKLKFGCLLRCTCGCSNQFSSQIHNLFSYQLLQTFCNVVLRVVKKKQEH